jgi:hypothetical protein
MANAISSVNLVDITTAKALLTDVLRSAIEGLTRRPLNVCLHGSPGLGKSEIVHQVAEELGAVLIDLRLSAMEASEVIGTPFTHNGVMKFSTPEWWPTSGVPCILFLDELKSAPPSVQTAAYRLILDRSIQNGKKLPANCIIVAAGNMKEDKTGARDLLPAAANRFAMHLIIDKKQCAEPFLNYAVSQGYHRSVVGYLTWRKESVYGEIGVEAAFATPRTWENVSDLMNITAISEDDIRRNIAVAGAVGSSEAMGFAGYLENEDRLPDWDRLRKGDESYGYRIPMGDTCLEYALATGMAFEFIDALNKSAITECENLAKSILSDLGDDMTIVMFKTLRRDPKAAIASLSIPSIKNSFDRVKSYVVTR